MSVVVVGGIFREIHDGDGPDSTSRMGGSGLTAAIVAACLGSEVALVGYAGDEDFEMVEETLESAGVSTSAVQRVGGVSGTFVFPKSTDPDARPWPMYRPSESLPATKPIIPAAHVYLSFGIPDYDPIASGWLDSIPRNSTLLWDRQGWLSKARDFERAGRLPSSRKIYLANVDEAMQEIGASTLEELLGLLPPRGYAAAAIKAGSRGSFLVDLIDGDPVHIPAFPLVTNSTIGSGDAFAAGLASALDQGQTLTAGMLLGNATAAAYLESGRDPALRTIATRVSELTEGGEIRKP